MSLQQGFTSLLLEVLLALTFGFTESLRNWAPDLVEHKCSRKHTMHLFFNHEGFALPRTSVGTSWALW